MIREFLRQFVCSRRPFPHRHDWPKWADVGTVKHYGYTDESDLSKRLAVGEDIVQHRRCAFCGLLQARRVRQ